jgi:acyl carrier protein
MQLEDELEQKIKDVMGAVFEISVDKIDAESSIDNIDLWDSMGHIKLILSLEKDFGIQFNGGEVIEMVKYSKIKEIIEDKTKST